METGSAAKAFRLCLPFQKNVGIPSFPCEFDALSCRVIKLQAN
jgi:hypothetical protein